MSKTRLHVARLSCRLAPVLAAALLPAVGHASEATAAVSPLLITLRNANHQVGTYDVFDALIQNTVSATMLSGATSVTRTLSAPGFMPAYGFGDGMGGVAVLGAQSLAGGTHLAGRAHEPASTFSVQAVMQSRGDGVTFTGDAFELHNASQLTLSFNVNLSATAHGCAATCENASASFLMVLSGNLFPQPQTYTYSVAAIATANGGLVTDSLQVPVAIRVDIPPGQLQAWSGFDVSTWLLVQGTGAVTTVPEPSSAALCLAGAALLAWRRRIGRARCRKASSHRAPALPDCALRCASFSSPIHSTVT